MPEQRPGGRRSGRSGASVALADRHGHVRVRVDERDTLPEDGRCAPSSFFVGGGVSFDDAPPASVELGHERGKCA